MKVPSNDDQTDPPTWTGRDVDSNRIDDNAGLSSGDCGNAQGSAAAEGDDELEDRAIVAAFLAALVDGALKPLEDWLQEARTSPEAEHRCIDAALALSSYADSLYKRVYR